jgi:hypothetical protein
MKKIRYYPINMNLNTNRDYRRQRRPGEDQSESSDEDLTMCLRPKMLGAMHIEAKGY